MTNGNPSVTGRVLYVTGLTKSYRTAGEEVAVLRGVNLTVAAGESVALTGESGSGKSTLLHLIAGLDAADGGEIRLADASVCELSDARRAELRRDRLGLVFQQFNLIPSLTVEDNLVFQSRIAGRHDAAWHHELVERLGLGNFLKRYPEQYPVASNSASRSAGHWPSSRCCCLRTSRPAISTRTPQTRCWRWRAIWWHAAAAVF